MSRYTISGSDAFDQKVGQDLQFVINAVRDLPESRHFLGAVLLGGYGRGEGTPLKRNGREEPFNDYDLVIVAKPLHRWQRKQVQARLHLLEKSLRQKIGIPIDLYLHTVDTLKRAEPSLLNVEMQLGHKILWGPENLLELMPRYSIADIPHEEGTRLLFNRGRLLLMIAGEPIDDLQKRTYLFKNYQAFGDCVLLAYGDYDPRYQTKLARLNKYLTEATIPHMEWIAAAYERALQFRITGDASILLLEPFDSHYEKVVQIFPTFANWYMGLQPQMALSAKERLRTLLLNALLFRQHLFPEVFVPPRHRLMEELCGLLREKVDLQRLKQFEERAKWVV